MKKKLIILSIVILFVFVAAVISSVLFMMGSASYEGKVIADVICEIQIERDKSGFPLIKAKTIEDAYFAVGYLHAQDRLAQIEYFRAISKGRVSEIIGHKGIMLDRLSRTIGFVQKADAAIGGLKSPYLEYLNSYVKGINSYKDRNRSRFFQVSDIPEKEWKITDVISILMLFEWADSYLNNHELIFPFLEGSYSNSLKDIIPDKLRYSYAKENRNNILILREIRKMLRDFVGSYIDGFAVYISGENTKSGNSLVCYNLDDDINNFPKWYPLSISVDNLRIDGLTISGLPFIFIGKNFNISFCGFNLKVDTQDFFCEEVRTVDERLQYLYRGVWKDFNYRNEFIRIGKSDKKKNLIALSVRSTESGPVISDIFRDTHKTDVITIKSIVPDESYISSLFEIPLSDSINSAGNLIRNVYSLPKIYLFASKDEAVQTYSGKLPLKNLMNILWDGASYSHWKSIIDLSFYNRMIRYDNIIIGSGIFENEPPVVKGYAVFNDVNRYYRLKELIEKENLIDKGILKGILYDTHSVIAEKFVPLFLSIMKKIPITSAKLSRIYFHNWDLEMEIDSVPASIFQTILPNMIVETVADELQDEHNDFLENYYLLIDNFYLMLIEDGSVLFDDVSTKEKIENRDMIFDRAFLRAMRFMNKAKGPIMENWQWGGIHKGRYHLPIKDDSLVISCLYEIKDNELRGGNSTIYKGSISAKNRFRTGVITALSGIIDENDMYISTSYGISLNPRSEYFNIYSDSGEFNKFSESEDNYILKIMPLH